MNTDNHNFTKNSTAEEVTEGIDLKGKNIVITGINSGIGQETMRVLEKRGAHIIGTARTIEKAKQAAEANGGGVTPLACELSDFESVQRCAADIKRLNKPIDVLICNAGIMALPMLQKKYGLEMQFVTNHLGHFLLTHTLIDSVKRAKQGRIIMLSSMGHRFASADGIDFNNLDGSQGYNDFTFYGQSKLANLLTAVTLVEKLADSNATAYAVHPGLIRTNLGRSMKRLRMFTLMITALIKGMRMSDMKSIAQGASTTCYVATAPTITALSGKYFADNNEAETTPHGRDKALANKLWDASCEILKEWL